MIEALDDDAIVQGTNYHGFSRPRAADTGGREAVTGNVVRGENSDRRGVGTQPMRVPMILAMCSERCYFVGIEAPITPLWM